MLKWILECFHGFTQFRSRSAYSSHLIIFPPTIGQRNSPPGFGISYWSFSIYKYSRETQLWLLEMMLLITSLFRAVGVTTPYKSMTENDGFGFFLPASHTCCSVLCLVVCGGGVLIHWFSPAAVPGLIKVLVQAARWTNLTAWRDNIFLGPTLTAGLLPLTNLAVTQGGRGTTGARKTFKCPSKMAAWCLWEAKACLQKQTEVCDHLLEYSSWVTVVRQQTFLESNAAPLKLFEVL